MPKELDERFGKINKGGPQEVSSHRRPAFRFSILYQYFPSIFVVIASLCITIIGAGNLGTCLYFAIYERDQFIEFLDTATTFTVGNFLYFTAGLSGLVAGVALWWGRWRVFAIALAIALGLFVIATLIFPL
jgi:hypothetical protein